MNHGRKDSLMVHIIIIIILLLRGNGQAGRDGVGWPPS
jgi:hypothetical protein